MYLDYSDIFAGMSGNFLFLPPPTSYGKMADRLTQLQDSVNQVRFKLFPRIRVSNVVFKLQ